MSFLPIRSSVSTLSASSDCYELLREFERYRADAYDAGDALATIGYGHVIRPYESWMKTTSLSIDLAEALLRNDVEGMEINVRELVKVPLKQGEFDALVSFAFNVGPDMDRDGIAEGLGDSTLLRLLNTGNYAGAAEEFRKWVMCRGMKLGGLVRRRAAERALFLGNDWRLFTRPDWRNFVQPDWGTA